MGERNEARRQKVLELYKLKVPYREITRQTGASSSEISDVAKEAGLLKKRAPESAPSAPPPAAAGHEALQQEGDGLTEFQPERPAPSAPKAPKQSALSEEKQTCPHCGKQWLLEVGESAPERCPHCRRDLAEKGQCGRCGRAWILDPGEAQPAACPACGVKFRGS